MSNEKKEAISKEEVEEYIRKLQAGEEEPVLDDDLPEIPESEEEEEEEEESEDEDEKTELAEVKRVEISNEIVSNWISKIQNEQTLPSLQKLYLCFYIITRPRNQTKDFLYQISSRTLQLKIILYNLKYSHLLFTKYETECSSSSDLLFYVNSLLKSLVFLFENDRLMYRQFSAELPSILSFLDALLPFFLKIENKKLFQYLIYGIIQFLKHPNGDARNQAVLLLLKICSLENNSTEIRSPDDETVIEASPFLGYVLRGIYFLFLNRLSYYSPKNFTIIQFLKSTLLEFFKISFHNSYTHIFLFLQELGKSLRNAMSDSSKIKYIYSWKYFHSLDLFSKIILSFHKSSKPLKKPKKNQKDQKSNSTNNNLNELIYPLVTIILGVLRLKSESMKFIPLRFKYIDILHRIQHSRKILIPSVYFITELFKNDSFVCSQKGLCKKPIDFEFLIRIPQNEEKMVLKTKEFQKICFDNCYFYILEFCWILKDSISFPEIVFPLFKILKHIQKRDKRDISHYLKIKIKNLISVVQDHSEFIKNQRKHLNFKNYLKKQNNSTEESSVELNISNLSIRGGGATKKKPRKTSKLDLIYSELKKERLRDRINNLNPIIFSSEEEGNIIKNNKSKKKEKKKKKRKRNVEEEEDEEGKLIQPLRKKKKFTNDLFAGDYLNLEFSENLENTKNSKNKNRKISSDPDTQEIEENEVSGDKIRTLDINSFFD